jgi:predicted dehydrogenase
MSTIPKPLAIAIIGTGLIGPRHAASVVSNSHTQLLALVDPSLHAQTIADSSQTAYYPSVSALISSEHKPHAAIICTPNSTHVSIAKELTDAGVHILVEKPLATDIESGKELIRFCEEKGVKLLVGHHRQFNPYITVTKKVLDAGKLGRVLAVSGIWANCKPTSYYGAPTEWRREQSAGAVLINLVHDVDLLQYLLGPIVRVHGEKAVSTRGY